jgi:putative ABC transport system ATP-binding protein
VSTGAREADALPGGTEALACRDVSAGYRSRSGEVRTVVTSVSFSVAQASRLVLIGRSGSGKSTLLRLLNRFDDPLSGDVSFRGASLATYDPLVLRRRVALVMQTPVVFGGTVRENLQVRPKHAPLPDEAALEAILDEVGLDATLLGRPAETLSVGEKQRLCLARALLPKPDVLLLDEPTSALDPKSLAVVAELILSLQAGRRIAVVAATHQLELQRRLGGDVLLLEGGTARYRPTEAEVGAFFGGV